MKYKWRMLAVFGVIISGACFKINDYLTLGYIPLIEWVLNAFFILPAWWTGLQIDKAKYYAWELKKKDEELNELLESVDAVIYSYDLKTKNLMISSKIGELYGRPTEEFKDNLQVWNEVIYPEDSEILNIAKQQLLEGRDANGEFRIQLPNGEVKWVQKRMKPILDSNGKLIKVHGIDIDIDERKKVEALLAYSQEQNRKLLEKRLEETEQRFKSLFVHHSDGIFTFNLHGDLIEANQAAEELIGYPFDELKHKKWDSIIIPKYQDLHREHFKQASEGKRQHFTLSIIHKNGSIRVVSLIMFPIITDNQIIGIYEIAKDITETKLTEEMIRRSDKLSVVGQLAAGVAHEIRNPLTTLRGFVQLFQSDIDERYVDIMLSELDRINMIVSEFLILSKPQVIKYEKKDIKQILHNTILLLEPQAIIKNIQFHLELDMNLPFIKCEQNQLKQVFINLLKNAMEAMPDGGNIVVKARIFNEETISILIIDEGVGIEEDQIPNLGEPFFSKKEDGTGLGLTVSFRIIENHGGTMNVSSQIHKGTTIEICLPIEREME